MSSANGTLTTANPRSAPFTPIAGQSFSVIIKGASTLNPCRLIRSLDGGTLFAPLARDAYASPALYTGDITFDVTETRSGVNYCLELTNPNGGSVAFEFAQ